MKKMKFLTVGLIAAMMVPAVAQAKPVQPVREAQRDYRHDVRDAKRDYRGDVRDARRDYREDVRDWRRDTRYQNYRAPFKYQTFRVGSTLRASYYAPAYRPAWDSRWGVPRAGKNLTYVRHYNDLLLVNTRTGKVVQVYRNHFRWR
ncbi:hypothetical protein [Sphingopyxis sp. PET50]|uniref:hypothetical protein n=1 Tax=Sphingopyxis sp. PET50 TaxID=2976533 RepID=UPI0021B057D1|nr:hypothetical protein [Sphingopyxis sp. PET50]